MSEHFFWITSRAAGIAALVFASLSVGLGLAMAARLTKGRVPDPRATHEYLSLAALAALAVHAFALLGDGYLKPSPADVTIPFVSDYETVWLSLGIVAGWATAVLGLSYYFRARIGVARWRALHKLTAVAWAASVVHALAMGTDATQPWFLLAAGSVVLPALALLTVRHWETAT